MYNKLLVDLIQRALEEDGAYADITTISTVPEEQWSAGHMITRHAGVIAGLNFALEAFRVFDERIHIEQLIKDGSYVQAGTELVYLKGPSRSLLSAERVALNFLGRLSGIATLTNQCVRVLEGKQTRILDTRKTTPGLRELEKMAVRLGGGQNHRFGLSDGVLIKDNHIKAAGGVAQAVTAARQVAPHLMKIEIECETLAEVQVALDAGADAILLDNMDIPAMSHAVEVIHQRDPKVLTEASGNIGTNAEKLVAVAETGVNFISLGALTHSAPNFDISLEFTREA
ncbi:MAG TPA: carboxylating nicotinate-nucleotide diphosphorylase [Dictyobacter sp.]|nr:carboxylating nicotinate-nucleotide diphosphorylase [Dictyobacter sp.]